MTDTPRTDARACKWTDLSGEWVDANVAQELERELGELTEHVGRCHDALGEDRASDTSELWKFFETHKRVIARLRIGEDDLAAERALADRLAETMGQIADGCGDAWSADDAKVALAAWKEARRGTH